MDDSTRTVFGAPVLPFPTMKVMVIGAGGFIGAHVAARLIAGGHKVWAGVRAGTTIAPGFQGRVHCDLARDHDQAIWAERLTGFDAVVNAAGILRPTSRGSFEAVHVTGPSALWAGCEVAGVGRVVQISALGDPFLTDFIGSKHQGDECLQDSSLDWTILRPSVVHSPLASYGGTTMLRALAALPGALVLPGAGDQQLQPVTLEDLCLAVAECLESGRGSGRIIELVGPEVVTLGDYLMAYRQWLGVAGRRRLGIPRPLVKLAATLGQWLGQGPMGQTMLRMLEQGNVGASGAREDTEEVLGQPPQSLAGALAAAPAGTGQRWQARCYLLTPVLRWALALTWIASGLVGLFSAPEASEMIRVELGWEGSWSETLIIAVSVLDLVLGLALLMRILTSWVIALMLISVLSYTLILGIGAPSLWFDLLGGMLKNLPLIPALALLMVLEDRR
jgi:uncharacterized protein YbjT (DUF2867 family)/uncharacterized membrane protein YphA (DoxX/SURF4 family)